MAGEVRLLSRTASRNDPIVAVGDLASLRVIEFVGDYLRSIFASIVRRRAVLVGIQLRELPIADDRLVLQYLILVVEITPLDGGLVLAVERARDVLRRPLIRVAILLFGLPRSAQSQVHLRRPHWTQRLDVLVEAGLLIQRARVLRRAPQLQLQLRFVLFDAFLGLVEPSVRPWISLVPNQIIFSGIEYFFVYFYLFI